MVLENQANNEGKNKGEEVKLTDVTDAFSQRLELDGYTFRLKKLKGKDLFKLVATFGFENSDVINSMINKNDETSVYGIIFKQFGDNFDYAMSNLEYSKDKEHFYPVIINGVYQVPELEENISMMTQLCFLVLNCVMLFMSTSR